MGVHEPPVPTARLIADALGVPLAYMYCEDDKVAALLLALHKLTPGTRDRKVLNIGLPSLEHEKAPNVSAGGRESHSCRIHQMALANLFRLRAL